MPLITEKRLIAIAISCCTLILGMMVSFPAGYDQAAFRVGGDMVVNGAIPYRDFIDTKPPVIFYIYAISSFLFGSHDWSIRIFDVLYHIVGILLFYKLLKKHDVQIPLIITTIGIYVSIYVGSGYWMTAQAETFALIPILLSTDIALSYASDRQKILRRGLWLGFLGAFLFLLKYTLLAIPIGIFFWLFTRHEIKFTEKIRFTITALAGIALCVALYAVFLSVAGGYDTWKESFSWLAGYSSIEPLLSPGVVIERYLKIFQMVLVEVFSLSLIVCCGIGLYVRYSKRSDKKFNDFITLCIIQVCIGIIATLYERKFFHYHYLKFLWAFAPIAAMGLHEAVIKLHNSWKSSTQLMKRVILIGFVGAFIFYSPILSLRQPFRWTYFRLAGTSETDILDKNDGSFPLKDMNAAATFLRSRLASTDDIFFWGNHVGIYSLVDKLPTTICLTNTPLSTVWTPEAWKQKLYDQLSVRKPKYIIIESNDVYTFISGSDKDSRQKLFSDTFLRTLVTMDYDSVYGNSHFDIYKMKSSIEHGL